MQRQKLLLPSLNPPLASTRISNYQDYVEWEKQKKKAYRAQLQQDISEHNRNRQKSHESKMNQRSQLNSLVQNERRIQSLQRSAKIKTQQKYMQENYNLIKRPSKNPRRVAETIVYKDHPFLQLVDKQERRKEETKNGFIYQNKLNQVQSEMKSSMKARKKQFEAEQRRKYIDHVEEEFNKHEQERQFFEKKYLKIEKNSQKNFKKEHLQFLREQAQSKKQAGDKKTSRHFSQRFDENRQSINASPWNIGQTPFNHDRKRQLETLQKSLKLFSTPKSHLQSSLNVHQQCDIKMGFIPKQNHYQKIQTQKSLREVSQANQVLRTERAQSSLNGNIIRYKPALFQSVEKQLKPAREPKLYKQFDIVRGAEKIVIA